MSDSDANKSDPAAGSQRWTREKPDGQKGNLGAKAEPHNALCDDDGQPQQLFARALLRVLACKANSTKRVSEGRW